MIPVYETEEMHISEPGEHSENNVLSALIPYNSPILVAPYLSFCSFLSHVNENSKKLKTVALVHSSFVAVVKVVKDQNFLHFEKDLLSKGSTPMLRYDRQFFRNFF